MESSDEIIFIALGMLIVIFAGTLALRLGIRLREYILINFKSLFTLVIGFSFWIYGNILVVKKLQNKTPEINKSKKPIEKFMDQDLKDKNKNKNEKKDLINVVKNKEGFHLNSLITKNISLFTKNPNYKMLAWLIVQLTIFSLFVLSVNIFKNNLIPYFNN